MGLESDHDGNNFDDHDKAAEASTSTTSTRMPSYHHGRKNDEVLTSRYISSSNAINCELDRELGMFVNGKENRHCNMESSINSSVESTDRTLGYKETRQPSRGEITEPLSLVSKVSVIEKEGSPTMEGVRLNYFDEPEAYSILNNSNVGTNNAYQDQIDERDCEYEYDDDDDSDDDCSEDSGDTVAHNDCPMPPPNATQEEINRFYWIWCYGPIITEGIDEGVKRCGSENKFSMGGGCGRSVLRSAPTKSW